MRPQLEIIQLLDNYLHQRLPEAERQAVEVRLLWDQDWQQQLAAQQLTYRALRLAGRKQLREELNTIHTRLFG
jgi:hypothetical protein